MAESTDIFKNGFGSGNAQSSKSLSGEIADDITRARVNERCAEIAALYSELYLSAEKVPSPYGAEDLYISDEAFADIENLLAGEGVNVIMSAGDGTNVVTNTEAFNTFWALAASGDDGEMETVSLLQSGGLIYRLFCYESGCKYLIEGGVFWNKNDEAVNGNVTKTDIDDWMLTDKGNFFYKEDSQSTIGIEDYVMIRTRQFDDSLWPYCSTYITPIGYQGNNLFICNWSEADFSRLYFSDLLEFLYKMDTGDYFDSGEYPYNSRSNISYISADIFEKTVTKYFSITKSALKQVAFYSSENAGYPWQMLGAGNIAYAPHLYPEVAAYRDNGDGTFTLTVDVICVQLKTDRYFTHEVTVRNGRNGSFRYVSNTIMPENAENVPDYRPRIPL